MRSSNEMKVDDLRSKVASLPLNLTKGYKKETLKTFQSPEVSVEWLVSIELLNGGKMVYSNEETEDKAQAEAAKLRSKGWSVSIEEKNAGELWYEGLAKESEEEISRIVKSWAERPKLASPTSALKLIAAHYNRIAQFLDRALRVRIKKTQRVDGEILKDLRDVVTSESTREPSVMVVRWRYNNLAEMFGSPENLNAYEDAVEFHEEFPYKASKTEGREYAHTETRWARSKVGRKSHMQLFGLVLRSLGKELVNPIPRKKVFDKKNEKTGEIEMWECDRDSHVVCLSPAELCEFIAHKLALGVLHEATTVEEVDQIMADFKRVARWLHRRANHPKFKGDLNPSELKMVPTKRHKYHESQQWDVGATCRGVLSTDGRGVVFGRLDRATTNLSFETVRQVESVVATTVTSYEAETDSFKVKGAERWLSIGSRNGAWIWDAPEGIVEETQTVKHTRFVDPVANYFDVSKAVVRSNVVVLPMPERVEKDWDFRFTVYGGRMVKDKTKPGAPQEYYGPSFVKLVNGELQRASKCTMHDGYRKWKKLPPCDHSHIQKIHLHHEWWYPKVDVLTMKVDKKGEPYEHRSTLLASKDSVGIVNVCGQQGCKKPISRSKYWLVVREEKNASYIKPYDGDRCTCSEKWAKKKFVELDEGVRMPLLVPALRRYIEDCVTERRFMAPPILEVTKKRGKFIGWRLDEMQRVELALEQAEDEGDPMMFELADELKKLQLKEKGFAQEWRTLHVFVPIDADGARLFDTRYLPPVGKGSSRLGVWGIQAQIYGPKANLMELVEEFGGLVQVSEYSEDDEGLWHIESTEDIQY